MRNILLTVCFMIPAFLSCTKEAEYSAPKETGAAPAKNSYRAKTISGRNAHWGDFKLELSYKNEKMDTARLLNAEGRKVGQIRVKLSSSTNQTYYVDDFVPKISPDSIQRLDERLTATYGKGNYTLEDSVPLSQENLFSAQLTQDKFTRETKITRVYYGPVDDPLSNGKYVYKYRKIMQMIDSYEYDDENNLIAERVFEDVYDADDEKKYERRVRKYEYVYHDKQLSAIIHYEAEAGADFTEYDRYQFNYTAGKLTTIQGQTLTKQFTYDGNSISSVSYGDRNYSYKYDTHGNVTRIDTGNGNYMEIEYEPGHGNIEQLLPFVERMLGDPYVK